MRCRRAVFSAPRDITPSGRSEPRSIGRTSRSVKGREEEQQKRTIMMYETIEKIVSAAKKAVRGYDGDEQYMIFEEASRRLLEEGRNALLEESLREEVKDE